MKKLVEIEGVDRRAGCGEEKRLDYKRLLLNSFYPSARS